MNPTITPKSGKTKSSGRTREATVANLMAFELIGSEDNDELLFR